MSADVLAPAPATTAATAAGFRTAHPSVSVLIATAGRPEMLREAVRAIVEQDYLNGESFRMDGDLRMAPR